MAEAQASAPVEAAEPGSHGDSAAIDKMFSLLGGTEDTDALEEQDTAGADDAQPDSEAEQAEDDAPSEGEASDEEQGEEAEQPETAAIGAPLSWSAEDKAVFASLPPEAQAVIARRESERDKATNSSLKEAAEIKKNAEAVIQAATQERQRLSARLASEDNTLIQQFAEKFSDIKSEGDLDRLAASDPARYALFQRDREKLQGRLSERAQLEARNQADARTQLGQYATEQRKLIAEKAPEFVDEKTGAKLRADSASYLKEIGYSQQEIDGVLDHRLYVVLADALKGRAYKQAATKVATKTASAPRVQTPVKPARSEAQPNQSRAATNKILRSGTDSERADVLLKILG